MTRPPACAASPTTPPAVPAMGLRRGRHRALRPAPGRAWRPGRAAVWVTVVVLVAVAAACGTDGRTLRRPSADQTTTTRPPSSDTVATAAPVPALQLTSPAFAEGGVIPDAHTCRGTGRSPALAWTGVPPQAAELALAVRDADAGGAVLWLVAGIPSDVGGVAEGTVPEGAIEAANDLGATGWSSPCPDAGTHHYEFKLYALGQTSGVVPGEPGDRAAERIEAAPALAVAALSATASAAPASSG